VILAFLAPYFVIGLFGNSVSNVSLPKMKSSACSSTSNFFVNDTGRVISPGNCTHTRSSTNPRRVSTMFSSAPPKSFASCVSGGLIGMPAFVTNLSDTELNSAPESARHRVQHRLNESLVAMSLTCRRSLSARIRTSAGDSASGVLVTSDEQSRETRVRNLCRFPFFVE